MIRHPVVQIAILIGLILFETVIVRELNLIGIELALYLVFFVFIAHAQGSMKAVVIGFCVGLAVDFLSAGPLGLHSFSMSLIGYLAGSLRGKLFLDPIFMPMLLMLAAGLINLIAGTLIIALFSIEVSSHPFSSSFVFMLLAHALLSPICFGLMRLVGIVPLNLRSEER
ncbi:rod shape-determining protein MreD [Marispirochaeta sp.]|jgi:rod shape-determining protein MreD|uniref:rod shape-determining protein MreD n=1 Tax=Marispirochaeta sp. TaxID=2038653 RepID=UPI0029C7B999|nr:rod shape-determining protein MreD [Marispirochaeta sp.]